MQLVLLTPLLRTGVGTNTRDFRDTDLDRRTGEVRAKVPAEHQGAFDALLQEARLVYGVRDERTHGNDDLAGGLCRRAVLEVGRRLEKLEKVQAADHAVELTCGELNALLRGQPGPSAEETANHVKYRMEFDMNDAPAVLGPPPGDPPPFDWFPPTAARVMRAVDAYVGAMHEEREEQTREGLIEGMAASPGVCEGIARVILDPKDFGRIQPDDILVARVTAPTYNVILPLLSGVVTDRGGLLSHPAIVAREFGIPGVVGTRVATRQIPDGARIRVDGDAGTVSILG
ncbi:MAG: hypothetical protein GY926_08725 [bacterium]|nr:hypothetical protein [bacterium]